MFAFTDVPPVLCGPSPGPPRSGDALLIVDMQRDFMPGGALAVPQGDAVLPVLNALAARFAALKLPVFASRDWHPPGHCSFRAQGGPWPPHCVAGTRGAGFAPGLRLPARTGLVSKGVKPADEGYSAFAGTDLPLRLRASGVQRLFVGGVATEYCVRQSVLDALAGGWQVVVLTDGVAAIDSRPGDGERALGDMRRAGALLAGSAALTA